MKILKVGVVGSRRRNSPRDKALIKQVLARRISQGDFIHLVSGGCPKGADKFAEELSEELGLSISIHYPDIPSGCARWEYAKACYERNTKIAEECHILIATWDGVSGGTADTIKKAKGMKKPCLLL